MKKKILSLKDLQSKIQDLKKKKNKIILCHGVFDLMHLGHLKHFQKAKLLGGKLVVTVTPAKYINKGINRPIFSDQNRLEFLSHIEEIDYIALNEWPSAIETISLLKPNFYVKGNDYKKNKTDITGNIKKEIKAIKSVKGKIVYTNEITFSSSNLINLYTSNLNFKQKEYLKSLHFKNTKSIKSEVDNFNNLKVLVIGEAIIDQYNFVEALGKSGKEPIMMFKNKNKHQYAGGALAIAKHVRDFSNHIKLITMFGEKEEYVNFAKSSLGKNIKIEYIRKTNSPTIVKKKFLDEINKNKVFGIYNINDQQLIPKDENLFLNLIKKNIYKYDLVILSDYGHGLVSENVAKFICKKAKFLAVNAQVNAANKGYHTISKYKNVDCVIINENELRYELKNNDSEIKTLIKSLAKKLNLKNLVVTRGNEGAILFNNKNKNFINCPAFASKVTDKVGAGDAMMSLISLCLKNKIEDKLSLLIGCLAGAQSVESIGNSLPINKINLLKNLEHLLK